MHRAIGSTFCVDLPVSEGMRVHGTLLKWNDDRGFGFVALPQSHEEIFVHISAFPRDGIRPRVGEMISFEVRSGSDGRKRAENVARSNPRAAPRRREKESKGVRASPLLAALAVVVAGAFAVIAYNAYRSHEDVDDRATFSTPQSIETPKQQFTCDGRTHCSQMTSCEEAVYFLQNCPNTEMDGNNDGEPCERQWC
jgi:cold shock CspA family protein